MKFFLLALLFSISCKGTIDSKLQTSILNILSENQKIHEQLLSNSDLIPDTSALLNTVKESISLSVSSKELLSDLKKLESILTTINSTDKEVFFETMSSFSERLTDILKANQINTDYNKFYCPMVAKYWVAKGNVVQNPYAPEMRECGEIVK